MGKREDLAGKKVNDKSRVEKGKKYAKEKKIDERKGREREVACKRRKKMHEREGE